MEAIELSKYLIEARAKLKGKHTYAEMVPSMYNGSFNGLKIQLGAMDDDDIWHEVSHIFTSEEMKQGDFESLLRMELKDMLHYLKKENVLKEDALRS